MGLNDDTSLFPNLKFSSLTVRSEAAHGAADGGQGIIYRPGIRRSILKILKYQGKT
jgi:hypothetical protein